jgi:hypothetical protein
MSNEELREAVARFNRRQKIQVKMAGGRVAEVTAAVRGPWAIHRDVSISDDGAIRRSREWWSLTHIPTGRWVDRCDYRAPLAVLADRLDEVGDWSSSDPKELPTEQGLKVARKWSKEAEEMEYRTWRRW